MQDKEEAGSNPSLSAKYHGKMEKTPVSITLTGFFLFYSGEEYGGFKHVCGGKNFWRKMPPNKVFIR